MIELDVGKTKKIEKTFFFFFQHKWQVKNINRQKAPTWIEIE